MSVLDRMKWWRKLDSNLPLKYFQATRMFYIFTCFIRLMWIFIEILFFFVDCARNYTALQGRFLAKNLDCDQYIHVPENYTITLYISNLGIFENAKENGECTENNSALNVSTSVLKSLKVTKTNIEFSIIKTKGLRC